MGRFKKNLTKSDSWNWLNICPFLKAEKRMSTEVSKPKNFDEALACEEQACALLKEVVKANKQLKVVQAASEGIRGNIEVQETMSKLQGRGEILWHYHSKIFKLTNTSNKICFHILSHDI